MANLMPPATSVARSSRQRKAATERLTQAEKERAQQVEAVRRQLAKLEQLHRTEFTEATREVVPSPALPKLSSSGDGREAGTQRCRPAGPPITQVSQGESPRTGRALGARPVALADSERNRRQAEVDRRWAGLQANEPAIVAPMLSAAFASGQRPVRVVAVIGGEVGLLVTTSGLRLVPEWKPAVTPSGAPTLHMMTATDRAGWQRQVVASQMLLAAKEAMALSPGLAAARVIAVDGVGAPVTAARIPRDRLHQADWRADAWWILNWLDPSARFHAAFTGELLTIDLRSDEAFRALVGAG